MLEPLILWSLALAVALAVWFPFARAHWRRVHADKERKAEATRLKIDRPAGQYPYIDPLRCVGCSSCVDACPEGDVLGVVGGTAVIVNGLRCIGIAACEEACPVGAIRVGLGDRLGRRDLPLLDDEQQTNLPGVFVAGELGGLSLVGNAVREGREIVARLGDRIAREPSQRQAGVLDLVVVGAGPAGLSAGLSARAVGLSFVILEREEGLGGTVLNYPRRKMVLTQQVDLEPWGSLSETSYAKEELLSLFEQLVQESRLDIRYGEAVETLERMGDRYRLRAAKAVYEARYVVLALGRRGNPRRLGVPGEHQGHVAYRLIDADSYRDARILVVGGGDSAVEAALALARESSNEVHLSYRKDRLVRVKRRNQEAIDHLIQSGRVRPWFGSEVDTIGTSSVCLRTSDGRVELLVDQVFVLIGGEPPFQLLRDLGVRFGGEDASGAGAPETRSATSMR